MIPMDSDYRAERAAERAWKREEQRKLEAAKTLLLIMERYIKPVAAAAIGQKIRDYL